MKINRFYLALFLILLPLAALMAGCTASAQIKAKSKGTSRQAFHLTEAETKQIQEIITTSAKLQEDAKKKADELKAGLAPDHKKIVEDYETRLTAINTDLQGNQRGLQLLLNSQVSNMKLQFVRDGKIQAGDVDKFLLYERPDKTWEIADAPLPVPEPSPTSSPATPASK